MEPTAWVGESKGSSAVLWRRRLAYVCRTRNRGRGRRIRRKRLKVTLALVTNWEAKQGKNTKQGNGWRSGGRKLGESGDEEEIEV
jgi:hypothetical protein